jgi:hypothetical protein
MALPCRAHPGGEALRLAVGYRCGKSLALPPILWHRSDRIMRARFFSSRRQHALTGILLGLLLLRAYVPVGFMPASGKPFLLQLCPAAAPVSMDPGMHMDMGMQMGAGMSMDPHAGADPAASMHHSGSHGHFDNCPFGSAPAAGPVSHFVVFQPAGDIAHRTLAVIQSWRPGQRTRRANQPRGPPLLS